MRDTDDGQGRTPRALWRRGCRLALEYSHNLQTPQDANNGHDPQGQWEPDLCLQMLRVPAASNYASISKQLRKASREWMLEFLERDGLGVLLESLEKLGAKGFCSFADTFSQLQCVSCLRAVMNSPVGLEYIIQNREYTRQLANILMSANQSVKLQVFELLCALCLYSRQGYKLALDSLNYFKQVNHRRRYRFDLVVHELQIAETVAYQTTLLAFINCVILGSQDLLQRCRIRNELFGIGLEDLLNNLRIVDDHALQIQLSAFDRNQEKDEELQEPFSINHLFDTIYKKVVNTPQVVGLQALLLALSQIDPADASSDRVWESLEEVFSEGQSPRKAWKNIGGRTRDFGTQTTRNRLAQFKKTLAGNAAVEVDQDIISHSATNSSGPARVPQLPSLHDTLTDNTMNTSTTMEICKSCLQRVVKDDVLESNSLSRPCSPPNVSKSTNDKNIPNTQSPPLPPPMPCSDVPPPSSVPCCGIPPPPPMPCSGTLSPPPVPCNRMPPLPPVPSNGMPPPPPMPSNEIPPPPPPMPSNGMPPPPPMPSNGMPPPPPMPSNGTPPPPPMPSSGTLPPPPIQCNGASIPVVEDFLVSKRVSENYHTLPSRKLHTDISFNKYNTLPKPSKKMKTLNWTKVPNKIIGKSIWASAQLPEMTINYSEIDELFCQKSRAKPLESQGSKDSMTASLTCLLDSKRSLAVNIFLKQFKTGAAGVLQALRECSGMPAEKIKGFLRILPDDTEVATLKSYKDNLDTLDTAERFFTELLSVPDYALRAQAMLQKEECPLVVADLSPKLKALTNLCDSLTQDKRLAEFLALLLQLGNYLNAGSYAGNAAGFKLNTLPKLLDTRANKPRMTFLHFAVDVAQSNKLDLLKFTEDVFKLKEAARNPLTTLEDEVNTLALAMRKLEKQVKAAKSKDILPKFKDFLKQGLNDVSELEGLTKAAKKAETKLAEHFCEDPSKFQPEECFLTLADFYTKVKQALVENENRKKMEEKVKMSESVKQVTITKLKNTKKGVGKIFGGDEIDLVDVLMGEIKTGNFKMRRSLPSGDD